MSTACCRSRPSPGRSSPGLPTDRRVPACRGSLEMARVVGCDSSDGSEPTSSNSKYSSGSGRFGLSAPTRVSSSASREKSLNSSRSDCGPSPRHRGCDVVNEDHASRSSSPLIGRCQHLRHLAGGGSGPGRQVVLARRADRIGRQDWRPFDVGGVGRPRQREADRGTGAVVGRPLGAVAVRGASSGSRRATSSRSMAFSASSAPMILTPSVVSSGCLSWGNSSSSMDGTSFRPRAARAPCVRALGRSGLRANG